jgi:hypothetical protein
MITEHDFTIGAHDYTVSFSIADNGDASFDGPFSIGRFEDDGSITPIDFASFTDDERSQLRRKLQDYAERDFDCRRYFTPEDDADRAYDDSNY